MPAVLAEGAIRLLTLRRKLRNSSAYVIWEMVRFAYSRIVGNVADCTVRLRILSVTNNMAGAMLFLPFHVNMLKISYWNETMSCIFKMDAVEWLKTLNDETIDLFITDPPYESLEKHRKIGTTTRLKESKSSSNKWFDVFPNDRFEELFQEIYRVLKKNSHFYLFCDQETMFVAKPLAEKVGFKFWKPIVWDKRAIGMGYHYRARYEFILFFEKGKRKLNNLGIPDILEHKRILRGYPTEKPIELLETLISQSSEVGQVVADSFFGSGSTLIAANKLSRSYLGCDISDSAHECFNNAKIQDTHLSE